MTGDGRSAAPATPGDDGPEPLPGPLWFQLSVPAADPR